jgi:hypoxanthine-DNA glycosylase
MAAGGAEALPAAFFRPATPRYHPVVPRTELLTGLPAIAPRAARVLVLGSMPGAASLAAGQYYAHTQNAFWWIMGELVGAKPEFSYPRRIAALRGAGIALWDVIGSCRRHGSLDSAIDPESIRVNDVVALIAQRPGIRSVLTNGGTASALFRRHLAGRLGALPHAPDWQSLPSTSPANASWSREAKLAAWRHALAPLLEPRRSNRQSARRATIAAG